MVFSAQSDDPRVLVATDAEGCRRICPKMRIVPKARPYDPPASRSSKPRQQPVAVRVMGLDILGPFPRATGNRRFVLVAINYFTKWVEAEALANIRDTDVKKFVWKNIVTRFGVPNSLVSGNGLQFDSKAFWAFCSDLGIRNKYSTSAYLQSNGQAKAVNKTILNGLKRRLDGAKGRWVEELPNVL